MIFNVYSWQGVGVFFMEVVMADLNKVKEIVEMIGLKAEEINDDIVEKVDAYKATLDTETRRELRKVSKNLGFFRV